MKTCTKCGRENNDTSMYCNNCGSLLDSKVNNVENIIDNTEVRTIFDKTVVNQKPVETNNTSENIFTSTQVKTEKNTKAIISLVIGIISILLSFIFTIFIIPFAIIGLVLALINKEKCTQKILGIIFNVLSIIISIIIFVIGIFILSKTGELQDIINNANNNVEKQTGLKTLELDGVIITYDDNWVKGNMSNINKDVLKYNGDKFYFLINGVSKYSDGYSCNFSLTSCQNEIYEGFYDYWNKDDKEGYKYYPNIKDFTLIKDDYYYVSFNYGPSNNKIYGTMYLVISEKNDVVISIDTNCQYANNTYDSKVLELMKTIKIKNDNTSNDKNEVSEILNDTSEWNTYSSNIGSKFSTNKTIYGGFKDLENDNYYVINKNDMYWYKSYEDLNDNYWYGTIEVYQGKNGLKKAGLTNVIDIDNIDNIIKRGKEYNLTENDFYGIVFKPTKLISNGIDKTKEQITDDLIIKYVFILVDHGINGIEAQILNANNMNQYYYYKLND